MEEQVHRDRAEMAAKELAAFGIDITRYTDDEIFTICTLITVYEASRERGYK